MLHTEHVQFYFRKNGLAFILGNRRLQLRLMIFSIQDFS